MALVAILGDGGDYWTDPPGRAPYFLVWDFVVWRGIWPSLGGEGSVGDGP